MNRFCAHEYEKCKDMAAAALAYKCTEVAYMRVIYSSHSNVGRDRHELQTDLQIVPLGMLLYVLTNLLRFYVYNLTRIIISTVLPTLKERIGFESQHVLS